jgi:hypothetical protein
MSAQENLEHAGALADCRYRPVSATSAAPWEL